MLSYGCRSLPPPPPAYEVYDHAMTPSPDKTRAAAAVEPGTRLDVSGYVDFDTVWDAASVHVHGDVKIAPGATLTIAPGARVTFEGHHAIEVQGALRAVGTPAEPITFTATDQQAWRPDSSLTASWDGLRFERTPAMSPPSRLEHCVIEYAKAVRDTVLAGAIVCDGVSDLTVVNSLIRRNVGHWGGALFCIQGSAPVLSGCVIVENTSFRGGSAVYALDSHPRLLQCTVADNRDLNSTWYRPSAAVLSYMSKPRLEGTVTWGNVDLLGAPAQTWSTKAFYTTWSNIQGGHDGEGNVDADPLFVAEGLHAFSTTSASPCRDAGPPAPAGGEPPAVDPAGHLRVADGRIDIGAYEGVATTTAPPPPPAPLTLDARPNPFNPSTEFVFKLERPGDAVLRIHDLRGMLVRTLRRDDLPAGRHALRWDGADDAGRALPSGAYAAELAAGVERARRLITLVR